MTQEQAPGVQQGAATGLRAIILAGGKGTRLRPFTVNFPKPLVPVGDRPILEVLMKRLVQHGITDITLTLGHLAELVKAYFHHRTQFVEGIVLRYVEEEEPTGTAGSLSLVPDLNDTFLVMNGDLLTDIDLHALVDYHRAQNAMLTIATHKRAVKIDLGVLDIGDDGAVLQYTEKPETAYHISMGIYVYEPRVLQHIQPGRYLDFPNLVHRLLELGERVCAYKSDCMWLDIGRPDDYARAQELFGERPGDFDVV
ncbi:MAG: NTP transferase domain-containing protein [Chloroflexi bacterium]|nr:NTP transferase domain-containing protein [Chloroflexota bacterium]